MCNHDIFLNLFAIFDFFSTIRIEVGIFKLRYTCIEKYKILKQALHMIYFVNLIILCNVHFVKFSETCFENKLWPWM